MPMNPTRSDLETAYKVALMPYFDVDCIRAAFESDRGEFDIELGAFDEDNPLNVCALDGDLTSDDFTDVAELDVIDEGTAGYCVLASEGEGAAALVDEVLAVASIVDGELAGIKPRTIETDPWWLPGFLTPSGRRTA